MGDVAPINSFSPTPKLFDDSQIPAIKALADSVHAYGTKLGVQLFHPEYDVDAINSLFMQKKFDEMRQRLHHDMMFFTDEVSEEMLMAIIDKMCACAVRAQKAGVDVIQIHGDRLNGCLCSTRMNHRTDKFGGSLEHRDRFARMLTRAIRKAVPDMVSDYKLSIVTPQRGKGGIDEADAVQFAQWLVEDAARTACTWKVLVTHVPAYYTNPTGGGETYVQYLPAACDAAGIDFYFSGNDHSYARTAPMTGGQVDENGTVYYICGSTGGKSFFFFFTPHIH